jgi:hypothetical protein
MGDSVFVNGRAVVHKGSAGKSIAFPDVCLCPPTPPAGPIPVPLPNTVMAQDLANGSATVLVEGNPAGTRKSFFAKSTGNEVSQPTGGGVVTHAVQGKAHFGFGHSFNTFYEGEPVVRHLDPLTHNHLAQMPGNTPPAPWLSTMDPSLPRQAPEVSVREMREGDAWIAIQLSDEVGGAVAGSRYKLKTPSGTTLDGRFLAAGALRVRGLKKGKCELVLPDVDALCRKVKVTGAPVVEEAQTAYRPASSLVLDTGKEHDVVAPGMVSFWVDLPIRARGAALRKDRFRLRSSDGKYDVVLTAKDDRRRGEQTLTLEFPALQKGLKYTLVHETGADDHAYPIFTDHTFEDLFPEEAPKADARGPSREVPAGDDDLETRAPARSRRWDFADERDVPEPSEG